MLNDKHVLYAQSTYIALTVINSVSPKCSSCSGRVAGTCPVDATGHFMLRVDPGLDPKLSEYRVQVEKS